MNSATVPTIRFSQAAQRATDTFWTFNRALKGLSGTPRAERGLDSYVSPKKEWDHPELAPTFEVLVPATPSSRGGRRRRQRNLAAMGKKSNRKAFRQRFQQHQAEQNFRGMARVYFGDSGNEAMYLNVTAAINEMARREAGEPFEAAKFTAALHEIEDMLHDVAVAYGDLD